MIGTSGTGRTTSADFGTSPDTTVVLPKVEPESGPATPADPPAAGDRFWRPHLRWIQPLLVVVLLGQMALGMVTAASQQSPTVDEPVYIAAAVTYLQQRDLRLNPEHPPLAKLVAATGLIFADVRLDPRYRGDQWRVGSLVLYGKGNDANHVLWLARVPMIVLTLLFGLVVFAFGRDLFGVGGGLLALALYSFSPDVIAHGSLATNDVPLAGFLLTTMWLLWRARRRPGRYLPLAGLAMGCALATKMTALPLLPVVLLLAALTAWTSARPDVGRPDVGAGLTGAGRWARTVRLKPVRGLGYAVGVGLLAVATVWATYLVVDPSLRYEPVADAAATGGLKGLAVSLLPLPEAYRDGLLVQFGFENWTFQGYLFGERYSGHLWYYLPAALLIKTPLGMMVLWLGAIVALLSVRRLRSITLYLLLPLALMLSVAMTGARSFGSRYVIWMPVFLAVAAAAVLTYRRRWVPPVALALVVAVAASSLATFPYYLPYSNEAFGGPANTYRHLNDSNVDWGQDLRRLGEYLAEHHPTEEQIWLIYKGRGSPSYYGIKAADPTKVAPDEVHGLLAVSAMRVSLSEDGFAPLIGGRTPIATIGHTIRVYRIP